MSITVAGCVLGLICKRIPKNVQLANAISLQQNETVFLETLSEIPNFRVPLKCDHITGS